MCFTAHNSEKIQLVPKAQLGSWGKGSSGGTKASEMGESDGPAPSLVLPATLPGVDLGGNAHLYV